MRDFIDALMQVLTVDIFMGYGLLSIVFVIVSLFFKDNILLNKFDNSSNRIIAFSGIIYFIAWMIGIYLAFTDVQSEEDHYRMMTRMFGRYWYGYWLQPGLYVTISQLLWFEKIRKSRIFRVAFSFLFIISFEMYVILITSLHRDYLPSNWTLYVSPSEIVFGLMLKTVVYLIFVGIVYLILDQVVKRFKKV